jgi:murein DD-endopeptidase MepM/ murein hydrolase activator NlpD
VGGGVALAVASLGTSVAVSQSIGPKEADAVTSEVATSARLDLTADVVDRDQTVAMLSAVAEKKRQEKAAAEAAAAAAEAAARAEEEARAKAEAEARAKAEAEAAAKAEAERKARAEEASRALARSKTPAGAKELARAMLADYGWGDSQFSCLDRLWTRESNWDYRARNPSSGAYGIPQALPGSKMATAGSDWRDNPKTQIEWGLGYIKDRYGTPCSAWSHSQSSGWY